MKTGAGRLIMTLAAALFVSVAGHAQTATEEPSQPAGEAAQATEMKVVIDHAVQQLLAMQEGENRAEWPYEGVYRVGRRIPIGYRVGGSAICAIALIQAPGYSDDQARQEAVARAIRFIIGAMDDPLMSPEYEGGYDVRGWGYTYALSLLLRVKANRLHVDLSETIDKTIVRLIQAIERTEIPKVGGWNYARGQGLGAVSPPAPFMTAPTLQALFEARKLGYAVDEAVVTRGLDSLKGGKTPSGSFRYAGINGAKSRESVPGSVGRMLVSEATLCLADRSTIADVRGAVDAFLVHWQWLEKRRAQSGTHERPYGVAPYYFFYAHSYAAQAIEMLPEQERDEYRRRLRELIMNVRSSEGTWNDRVFPRSANYGTAMSILALTAANSPQPARWVTNAPPHSPTDIDD